MTGIAPALFLVLLTVNSVGGMYIDEDLAEIMEMHSRSKRSAKETELHRSKRFLGEEEETMFTMDGPGQKMDESQPEENNVLSTEIQNQIAENAELEVQKNEAESKKIADYKDEHEETTFQKIANGDASETADLSPEEEKIQNYNVKVAYAGIKFYAEKKWTDGIVPVDIENGYDTYQRNAIQNSMNEINDKTCVKLETSNPQNKDQYGELNVVDGDVCGSYVGRVIGAGGTQPVIMSRNGCFLVDAPSQIMTHEFLHALGFWHEMGRPDRNSFIEIDFSNVKEGRQNNNFAMYRQAMIDFPYDYQSIMQYKPYTSSIDGNKKTIKSDLLMNDEMMGASKVMSYWDVASVNSIYCGNNCQSLPDCAFEQVQDLKTCACACYSGMTGPSCDTTESFVEDNLGGTVMVDENNPSPRFVSNPVDIGKKIQWMFVAPENKIIILKLHILGLPYLSGTTTCSHTFEMRLSNPGTGSKPRCYSTPTDYYSRTNMVIVEYDSTNEDYVETDATVGYDFTVTYADANCANPSAKCIKGICGLNTDSSGVECKCDESFEGPRCNKDKVPDRVYECSFEDDAVGEFCPFYSPYDSPDFYPWNKGGDGPTPSKHTGPLGGHLSKTYAYTEVSKADNGDKFKFLSYLEFEKMERCLIMWYNMYGSATGKLSVMASDDSATDGEPEWSESGNQGQDWKEAVIDIPASTSIKIVVEAVGWYTGDIAIDDLTLKPYKCAPHPCLNKPCGCGGTCSRVMDDKYKCTCKSGFYGENCEKIDESFTSFRCDAETEDCCFDNYKGFGSTPHDYEFIRGKDETPSNDTGPEGAKQGDYYYYADASSPVQKGDVARWRLQPSFFDIDEGYCLRFWYNLYGDGMGKFWVNYTNDAGSDILMIKEGNRGPEWHYISLDIPQGKNVKVDLSIEHAGTFTGDAALDDLTFSKGLCSKICKCGGDCFLEEESVPGSQYTWKQGIVTGLSDTGPNAPFEGDCYFYADASDPAQPWQKAVMSSSEAYTEPYRSLNFAYCLNGVDVGNFIIAVDGVTWHRSGSYGPEWRTECIDFPATDSPNVFVTARKAGSPSGDIVFDKMELSQNGCGCKSRPCALDSTCVEGDDGDYTCSCAPGLLGVRCEIVGDRVVSTSFEVNEPEVLREAHDGLEPNYAWSSIRSETKTYGTGPVDNSWTGSNYMFVEASKRYEGDVAHFETIHEYTEIDRCLTFNYNMNGPSVGSLTVYEVKGDGSTIDVGNITGDQGSEWKKFEANVSGIKIGLRATRGNFLQSDIAIDDWSISPNPCTPIP